MLRVRRVCSDLLRPRFLRWPPALTLKDAPLLMAPPSSSAHPTHHPDRRSRMNRPSPSVNPIPWRASSLIPIASATTKCCEGTQDNKGPTPTQKNNNPTADDRRVYFPPVHSNSTHRDGAIYKNKRLQKEEFWFPDLADRTETHLDPMRYSDDTLIDHAPEGRYSIGYPVVPGGKPVLCHAEDMIQFFSVLLSKSPVSDDGPVELYGYIAVREELDGMLNYVVNYSRDDPAVVRQGSPIAMTGPKRGIAADYMVLMEFDMRIKNGAREEDDLQLIDGAMSRHHRSPYKPVKHRVVGDCGGAVDMSFAAMGNAVEATIEEVVV